MEQIGGITLEHEPMTVTMCARVIGLQDGYLLVCDCSTRQEVLVRTSQACCFSCGDFVRIEYSGAMTMRLPPQISASSISRVRCC